MLKIKEHFIHLIKKCYSKFPITNSFILIFTLLMIIFMNDINDLIETILLTIIVFSSTTFYLESKNCKKYLYSLISLLAVPLHNINSINEYGNKIIICYIISIIILGIYHNFKNCKVNPSNYLINVLVNSFKTTLVYGILNIGILSIIAIINTLIININSFELIERSVILITGVYYFPRIIYGFTEINDINKFVKIIIKYVLNSLIIIAFIIIYLYIIKILIIRNMPSNEVFRVISILFITGLPIWTMASEFKDNNILDKINNILPLLFIPFILLQMYSLGIRIIEHGLTPTRYLGIMLIIFEIIYLIIYFKNKHIEKLVFVFIIILNISLLAPYINMDKLSIISQYHNLKIYTSKKELNEKDKVKISGAYYYLRGVEDKLIDNLLTKEDINNILSFNEKKYYDDEYYHAMVNDINISGYDKLNEVNIYEYDINNIIKYNDITIDISHIINNDTLNNFENYIKNNNEIIIDNKQKLVIKSISINYNKYTNEYKYLSIEGYLLKKD